MESEPIELCRNGINWVFNVCCGAYFVYHVTKVPHMYHPRWKLITLLLILRGETTWSILRKRMFLFHQSLLNCLYFLSLPWQANSWHKGRAYSIIVLHICYRYFSIFIQFCIQSIEYQYVHVRSRCPFQLYPQAACMVGIYITTTL